MKWTADDYKEKGKHRKLTDWKVPNLVYPAQEREKSALRSLRDAFSLLLPYRRKSDRKVGMEWQAIESNELVSINVPIPVGHIAFLENTGEKCTSPQTKHSEVGMQSAKHWVQRVDTPEQVSRRLTDGYGISLMFDERFHQFIRNSNNWRGISGVMLDLDVFKDDEHPDWVDPVYSLDELLERYPLLTRICSFIMPSVSSLYDGRPFKARGIVLFDNPVTDQRVYRSFGDTLLKEIDCIPQNITKTPVAVGFGNTHNAKDAWYNNDIDQEWIAETLIECQERVIAANKVRNEQRRLSKEKQCQYQSNHTGKNPRSS